MKKFVLTLWISSGSGDGMFHINLGIWMNWWSWTLTCKRDWNWLVKLSDCIWSVYIRQSRVGGQINTNIPWQTVSSACMSQLRNQASFDMFCVNFWSSVHSHSNQSKGRKFSGLLLVFPLVLLFSNTHKQLDKEITFSIFWNNNNKIKVIFLAISLNAIIKQTIVKCMIIYTFLFRISDMPILGFQGNAKTLSIVFHKEKCHDQPFSRRSRDPVLSLLELSLLSILISCGRGMYTRPHTMPRL